MEQTNLTAEELDEIERRCAAATAGPWICHGYGSCDSLVRISQSDGWPDDPVCDVGNNVSNRDADAEFIAHARSDVPRLLAVALRAIELEDLYEIANQDRDALQTKLDLLGHGELDHDLWAIMKTQRDEALGRIAELEAENKRLGDAGSCANYRKPRKS
jgi:hypothetical protein